MTIVNKKIFFWGSKPLGFRCFNYLNRVIETKYNQVKIVGVCVSEKDLKKDGVKNQNIKEISNKYKIPYYTEKDKCKFSGDVGICVGYPHKIPTETIRSFKNGIINLHFAPLPYYRGSKTLSHAIINKETKYGLSFHYIDESLDTGSVIAVKWEPLSSEKTAKEIIPELERSAFIFFKEFINRFITEKIDSVQQDVLIKKYKIKPKYYSRNSLQNLYKISPHWTFERKYRMIRALTLGDENQPYIEKDGKKIYLSIHKNEIELKV